MGKAILKYLLLISSSDNFKVFGLVNLMHQLQIDLQLYFILRFFRCFI